jgi:hypothetical protein
MESYSSRKLKGLGWAVNGIEANKQPPKRKKKKGRATIWIMRPGIKSIKTKRWDLDTLKDKIKEIFPPIDYRGPGYVHNYTGYWGSKKQTSHQTFKIPLKTDTHESTLEITWQGYHESEAHGFLSTDENSKDNPAARWLIPLLKPLHHRKEVIAKGVFIISRRQEPGKLIPIGFTREQLYNLIERHKNRVVRREEKSKQDYQDTVNEANRKEHNRWHPNDKRRKLKIVKRL